MKPLFMWAGGKTKLLKHYRPFVPINIDTYVEPFLGGGAMFCEIMKSPPRHVIINDALHEIMIIYQSIRNDPTSFLKVLDGLVATYLLLSHADRKKYYYDIREQHAWDWQAWSIPHQAAVQYFLMKTGFNGIWQINKNTNGRFGTPAGLLTQTTKVYDFDNVMAWHNALQKVTIMNGPWQAAVKRTFTNHDFIFFDPPYRDAFTSYGQSFDDDNQLELLHFCQTTNANIILCNKATPDKFFEHNKGPLNIEYIETAHTAGRRSKLLNGNGHKSVKVKELFLHNGRKA